MSIGIDELRLAAALAHCSPDGELQLTGPDRRWLVSRRRQCATVDPCGFRQLVVAAARGCRTSLLPADHLRFVGALTEIGGGVFECRWDDRPVRKIATFLAVSVVEALVDELPDAGSQLHAIVQADPDLGVTVITLAASGHPVVDLRLDAAAQAVAAACMVEELIASTDVDST